MTTTTGTLQPPLATDSQGNPLHVPKQATAWRVRRHTGGRPRTILGTDRQPLRLPLDITARDLEDILGPGSYRLEAIDDAGDLLDCVACVGIGDHQPGPRAYSTTVGPASNGPIALAPTGRDLRAALEANIHMARSLSDAVRVLSEAQADWTKGLASAKQMPRNAAPTAAQLAAMQVPAARSEDDDEEEPQAWYERLLDRIPGPLIPATLVAANQLAARFMPAAPEVATAGTGAAVTTAPAARAATTRNAEATAEHGQATEEPEAEPSPQAFQPTPELMAKVKAIGAHLEPDERRLAMRVILTSDPRVVEQISQELAPLSIDEAVEWVRSKITKNNNSNQEETAEQGEE